MVKIIHTGLLRSMDTAKYFQNGLPELAEIFYTGLFTRGVLLNLYFAATNNTNGSN
jgi:hypothetical protein